MLANLSIDSFPVETVLNAQFEITVIDNVLKHHTVTSKQDFFKQKLFVHVYEYTKDLPVHFN